MRLFWRGVQAEQVGARPAHRLSLLAPYREEPAAVLDALPPALDRDVIRASGLQDAEGPLVTARPRQFDDRDLSADAARLGRDRLIGCARLSRLGLGQEGGALLMDQDRV